METRASHILIGSFVLLLVGALFGFVIWLARLDGAQSKEYDIYFRDSVAGLAVGGVVRFSGVPVGQVREISLVKDDPSRVRVRIRLNQDVPILEGTIARLDAQGLTGVSFVQLEGGYQGAPPLAAKTGEDVPVIPSRVSAIQSLFTSAPQLLEQATIAVTRIGMLLNEKNRASLGNTLANLDTTTKAFANRSGDIEKALAELSGTMVELRKASTTVNLLAENTNGLIDTDARELMANANTLAKRANSLVGELDGLVKESRPGISQLADTTLPELTRLVIDLRQLTRSLTAVSEKLESGGAAQALLGGNKAPEYVPAK
jgi:phospholipid/cholesterol/gamma-HCH transport system substrate-binding protein